MRSPGLATASPRWPEAELPLRTEVIAGLDDLRRIERLWWSLWERCPPATPFQSPAWLLPWWEVFAPGRLAAIAAWRDNELYGLAAFYLEPNTDRLLPAGISLSDYLDVLIDPDSEEEAGTAIVHTAVALPWREWSFEDLAAGACAMRLPVLPGTKETVSPHHAAPVIPLCGGDDLCCCVPARRRRQLRRAIAAAERLGEISIERKEDAPKQFLDELIRLHGARWEGDGVLNGADVLRFHRLALPRLAARGLARCWLMSIDGKPVGAYYGFGDHDRAYAYIGGFDPDYSEVSPGSILTGHAIRQAIREGAREFHFLRGGEAYKFSWGAKERWTSRRVFTRTETS
ncbi:GNAT family N-acetyltransferase [Pseudaminobacter sp. 19-2017]|uniref:GNAT family N-acetyltransferase n=1 Tax=Pseudaminobacter soli (ex Zhang et al. 2022) TaxID=2831468 RepID=A0A942E2Z2_9HYPH|nr:GNAT family N-acetyltransferase [Pseudaminobacter soli]MBS3647562.1 GNAT family N-acetyltransferase [Pseudaminobacter soli]